MSTATYNKPHSPAGQLLGELAQMLSAGTVLRENEPLAKRTTLRVGGAAEAYVEPANEDDLAAVVKLCNDNHVPFFVIGRGSNLLIKDEGIKGVVVSLTAKSFLDVFKSGDELYCGAGARLKTVAVEARRNGLAGLEFLEGIPGSVGGGLRMNAGAMGRAMFEAVDTVRFVTRDGSICQKHALELHPQYRSCDFFRENIAVSTKLKGTHSTPEEIAARMAAYSEKRWKTQPAAPSAGCIFKNPLTIPAGKLVEELGLKGTRVGGAVVSDVHGNFIVNDGTATAQDVLQLIQIIKEAAKTKRGIELETEVQIIG